VHIVLFVFAEELEAEGEDLSVCYLGLETPRAVKTVEKVAEV